MLKIVGIGLLGLFALMVIPSGVADEVNPMFYGTANVILADPSGNVLMAQTVHNLITDEGETFIIDQVFDTGTTELQGTARVSAICIMGAADNAYSESAVNSLATGLTGTSSGCHAASSGGIGNSGSIATVGPETFTAGTDFTAGEEISGILICAGNAGAATFALCSTPGAPVALAALSINNVTVSGTDTVTITSTFDITTDGS